MLPLKEWPESGSTVQFNRKINPTPASGALPPPITPSLLGMTIGQAIRNSRNADVAALSEALDRVKFEPEPTLATAFRAEFVRRSAPIEFLDSPDLAERVRKKALKDLPTDVDAILDVQLYSAGYYAIGKGLGFSPYFLVTAKLLDTINPGEIIEESSPMTVTTTSLRMTRAISPRQEACHSPTLPLFRTMRNPSASAW